MRRYVTQITHIKNSIKNRTLLIKYGVVITPQKWMIYITNVHINQRM